MIIAQELQNRIIQYYVDAGLDYAFWSRGFNMHFGFGGLTSLFAREKMLREMSRQVLAKVLPANQGASLADFGCGVGATMRAAVELDPEVSVSGITIVPWQKDKGDELNGAAGGRLKIVVEDYHSTSLQSLAYDGVYAIESACYSPSEMHQTFCSEMFRILKPGGKMVIADGFLKVPEESLNSCVRNIYNGICRNWALPGMMNIERIKKHLSDAGFRNIRCEEVSWKVAPSVLHVPFVILWFLLHKKCRREKLSMQSIRNLKGSFQTLLLGLNRRSFGYYLVSAEK
jgi:MPBQ/MSBQ methyltransferase